MVQNEERQERQKAIDDNVRHPSLIIDVPAGMRAPNSSPKEDNPAHGQRNKAIGMLTEKGFYLLLLLRHIGHLSELVESFHFCRIVRRQQAIGGGARCVVAISNLKLQSKVAAKRDALAKGANVAYKPNAQARKAYKCRGHHQHIAIHTRTPVPKPEP